MRHVSLKPNLHDQVMKQVYARIRVPGEQAIQKSTRNVTGNADKTHNVKTMEDRTLCPTFPPNLSGVTLKNIF